MTTGSTVYIAGAGPVGLAAATSAFLLGAAVVIVGDLNQDRQGAQLRLRDGRRLPGRPQGPDRTDPRRTGGRLRRRRGRASRRAGTGDSGAPDAAAREGSLSIRIGLGWAKSHALFTGQCPVMRYNRQLMMAILYDRVSIAANVNATPIPLDQTPQGYQDFDQGAATKYVLDPHGMIEERAAGDVVEVEGRQVRGRPV